ncbi:RluA family pseudouridine synthase [Alkalihalobacillus sp. LMS6]|uniref:RluA family pseudouridine synthase n=1 Tax=Bacillaceae TaxID=186817 RepID=UPI000C08A655|nr:MULTISPECIES: RluA family pseudouridine synthase [Bacillaceae]UTR04998.1 RluA family pseudouridine synthase [Alkalihalobacillus sp. LMS6]
MNRTQFIWRVQKSEHTLSLRAFLRERKNLSKRLLSAIKFQGGGLYVNDCPVSVRAELKEGDEVRICLPVEEVSPSLKPQKGRFTIYYEDADVLVVHKPADVATIPSKDHPDHTLANSIMHYYHENGIHATFHAVNRLDRGTSGLLLVAKHRYAHDLLSKAQKQGALNRTYAALVTGVPPSEGTISAPIGRKETSIIEREVRDDGKPAVTHYKRIATNGEWSLVHLRLETGRTHQIRVHLKTSGYPIIGDGLYGGDQRVFTHQALHCFQIHFTQPLTNEKKIIQSDLPSSWDFYTNAMKED